MDSGIDVGTRLVAAETSAVLGESVWDLMMRIGKDTKSKRRNLWRGFAGHDKCETTK